MVYKMINITWNPDKDQTRIKYLKDYNESDWVEKLDMLSDVLGELKETYNSLLTDTSKEEYEYKLQATQRIINGDLDGIYESIIKKSALEYDDIGALLDLLNDYRFLRDHAYPIFTEKGKDDFLKEISRNNLTGE